MDDEYGLDSKALSESICEAIITKLLGRKGFDYWFEQIEEDMQQEIKGDLSIEIQRVIDGSYSK